MIYPFRRFAYIAGALTIAGNVLCITSPSDLTQSASLAILSPAPDSKLIVADSITFSWNKRLTSPQISYKDFSKPADQQWQELQLVSAAATSCRLKLPDVPFDTLWIRVRDTASEDSFTTAYAYRYFSVSCTPVKASYSIGDTLRITWHPSELVISAVVSLLIDGGRDARPLNENSIDYPDTSFTWVVGDLPDIQLPLSDCDIEVSDYEDGNRKEATRFGFKVNP